MFLGLRATLFHAENLGDAKAWYARVLGVEPYFDAPFYVGFNIGGYELGLAPKDSETDSESLTYWGVANAEDAFKHLCEAGATPHHEITDVGDGIRVGAVKTPHGNVVGIIENPIFDLSSPPLPSAVPTGPGR